MSCIFCNIIQGTIPSSKVYEDDAVYAFHDIHPMAPVHILVVPKEHIPSADGVNAQNSASVARIFEAIPKIAAAAGLANGFFGGGGGSVLVPLLTRYCGMDRRRALATSVAVSLPLCVLSAVIYFLRGGLDLTVAWPYLLGGTAGGWLGGKLFRGVRIDWLRRGFGLLLIYGGLRYIL